MNEPKLDDSKLLEALRQVIDPELGCNLVDLGLIYSVESQGSDVLVRMTLTSAGCPMHESLARAVQMTLLTMDGVEQVDVELVWDPPWNPSMMSEEARAIVGYVGS